MESNKGKFISAFGSMQMLGDYKTVEDEEQPMFGSLITKDTGSNNKSLKKAEEHTNDLYNPLEDMDIASDAEVENIADLPNEGFEKSCQDSKGSSVIKSDNIERTDTQRIYEHDLDENTKDLSDGSIHEDMIQEQEERIIQELEEVTKNCLLTTSDYIDDHDELLGTALAELEEEEKQRQQELEKLMSREGESSPASQKKKKKKLKSKERSEEKDKKKKKRRKKKKAKDEEKKSKKLKVGKDKDLEELGIDELLERLKEEETRKSKKPKKLKKSEDSEHKRKLSKEQGKHDISPRKRDTKGQHSTEHVKEENELRKERKTTSHRNPSVERKSNSYKTSPSSERKRSLSNERKRERSPSDEHRSKSSKYKKYDENKQWRKKSSSVEEKEHSGKVDSLKRSRKDTSPQKRRRSDRSPENRHRRYKDDERKDRHRKRTAENDALNEYENRRSKNHSNQTNDEQLLTHVTDEEKVARNCLLSRDEFYSLKDKVQSFNGMKEPQQSKTSPPSTHSRELPKKTENTVELPNKDKTHELLKPIEKQAKQKDFLHKSFSPEPQKTDNKAQACDKRRRSYSENSGHLDSESNHKTSHSQKLHEVKNHKVGDKRKHADDDRLLNETSEKDGTVQMKEELDTGEEKQLKPGSLSLRQYKERRRSARSSSDNQKSEIKESEDQKENEEPGRTNSNAEQIPLLFDNEKNTFSVSGDNDVFTHVKNDDESPYNPEVATPLDLASPSDAAIEDRTNISSYKDVGAFEDIMKSKIKHEARKHHRRKVEELKTQYGSPDPTTKEGKLVDYLVRQAQVEEEMKNVLKPYFKSREITKEEYKNILKKAVPQVAMSNSPIISSKIQSLMTKFVRKCKGNRLKEESRIKEQKKLAAQQKQLQLQLQKNADMFQQIRVLNPNLPMPPM